MVETTYSVWTAQIHPTSYSLLTEEEDEVIRGCTNPLGLVTLAGVSRSLWARRAFDLSNETAPAELEIQTLSCPDVEVRADTGSAKATTALGNSVLDVS
jgi:hypothetical protein